MLISHRFRAFNTEIFLSFISDNADTQKIIEKLKTNAGNFEKKFSRFNPASELTAINNKKTAKIKVSSEMLDLLAKAQKAYKETKGLFDPTILESLRKAGYDRSFDLIKKNPPLYKSKNVEPELTKKVPFSSLKIDKRQKTISAPTGLRIDLGGIAKGYWVDKARKILEKYSKNYWLSAGGDLLLKGKNENGTPWEVGVQNPIQHDSDILKIKLPSDKTGIATSGITYRKGLKGKRRWHHIIDPRTGTPVKNTIYSVSVIAKSAMDADIMAKTVLILGIKKGLAFINGLPDYECIIIDDRLKKHLSKGMKKYGNLE